MSDQLTAFVRQRTSSYVQQGGQWTGDCRRSWFANQVNRTAKVTWSWFAISSLVRQRKVAPSWFANLVDYTAKVTRGLFANQVSCTAKVAQSWFANQEDRTAKVTQS